MKRPPTATEIVRRAGRGGHFEMNHEPSLWLRSQVAELLRLVVDEQVKHCPHPPGEHPAVIHLRTRGVTCLPCSGHVEHPTRCDRCVAEVDGIREGAVAVLDPLIVIIALCPACLRRESGVDW